MLFFSKSFRLLAILIISASVLVACGDDSDSSNSSANTSSDGGETSGGGSQSGENPDTLPPETEPPETTPPEAEPPEAEPPETTPPEVEPPETEIDTTPDNFSFNNQGDVELDVVIESNIISVRGINASTSISVSGGQYAINGGAYTASTGEVENGNTVQLMVTSSSNNAENVDILLNIGGVIGQWTVTTIEAVADTEAPIITIDAGNYTDGSRINLSVGDSFTPPVATAIDNIDGDLIVNQTNDVDMATAGSYTVNYSASDAAGNTANATLNVAVAPIVVGGGPAPVSSIEQYAFHHSLWQHNVNTLAATPLWINDFASATGVAYETNGHFDITANTLPSATEPQTGYSTVAQSWLAGSPFQAQSLNNIIYMPLNYVQYDAPANQTANLLGVLDYLAVSQPGVPVYIYEHWPELGDPFPPSPQMLQNYYNIARGSYHQWFIDYYNLVVAARPAADIYMIPVGPIIADILTNPALQASRLAVSDLYEDSAPHGYDDLYFLAGLVTFQATYRQQPPDTYRAPASISRLIADDFAALNDYVWQRLNDYDASGIRVWP